MARSQTARLELNNPYAKYGLKLKPTFNEIVSLVSENENSLKPFPDRRATQFRNSPQELFFDGSDHIELLKEQQGRIHDRQIRELLMRRQMQGNGGTLHVEQHLQNSSGTSTPIMSERIFDTLSDVSSYTMLYHADVERRVQERLEGIQQRQQEVAQGHSQAVGQLNDTLTRNLLRQGFSGLQGLPPLEPVEPAEPSEDELIPAEDETRPYQKNILYFNNDIEAMRQNQRLSYTDLLFQLNVRGKLTDEVNRPVDELPDEISKKMYLLTVVQGLIGDGSSDNNWQINVESQLLASRIREWRQIQRGGGRGMLRQFLASAGSVASDVAKTALQEVGKGIAKGAVSSITGT